MDAVAGVVEGLKGPRVTIDPRFSYYKNFDWGENARHVKEDGFTSVDLVIVDMSIPYQEQKAMIDAFHKEGLACTMRLFPPTEPNLYAAHPEWRQVMLGGGSRHDWRSYCCPNNEPFVTAYCKRVEETIRECPYDGVQLCESWFEVWGGPYPSNASRDQYACLCGSCRDKFHAMTGLDPIELFQEDSQHYFEKNEELYQKWVDFRVDTVIEFDKRILESAQKGRPGLFTEVMFLSDCMHNLNGSREYQAQDLERIVGDIRPDGIVIQDAWQEWIRQDLKPDFIKEYAKEYIPRIKKIHPSMVIHSHADIGSKESSKRSVQWILDFRKASRESGFDEGTFYEYSVSRLAPKPQ